MHNQKPGLSDVLLDTIQRLQQEESNQRLGSEGQGHNPGCRGPMVKESCCTHVVRWLHSWLHDSSNANGGNDTSQRHQRQLGRHGHVAEALQLCIREDRGIARDTDLEQHHGLSRINVPHAPDYEVEKRLQTLTS